MNKKRGVILVLFLFFLLILSLGRSQVEGCYYYPKGSPDLYCVSGVTQEAAEEDCLQYPDCAISQYFSPGKDCSEMTDCELITCNVNCEDITRGECEREYEKERGGVDVGWGEVSEEEYNDWCSAGCCKAGEFCHQVNRKWECLRNAKAQGLDIEVWDINIFSEGQCNENVCGWEALPATLKGYVLDKENNLLSGAKVEIEGIAPQTTGSDGNYQFEDLSPNSYLVKVSKEGFVSTSELISLSVNETLEFNFTLEEAIGVAALSGEVKDGEGSPVKGAMVSWAGPTEGFILADDAGFYNITGLVLGDYTFRVSKYGYATKEEPVVISDMVGTKNFILEKARLQGIKGKVFVDKDGDGEGDYEVYGANIYGDGIFRGYSQYFPLGYYEVSLEAGEHEIYATYYDFELKDKFNFTLGEGETVEKDLVLTKYVGECSVDGENPDKAVENFSANPVLGEKKVRLEWTKPCPEVSGYKLLKYKGEELIAQWTASPADFYFIDEAVAWGESYTYQIKATYSDVEPRESEVTEAAITLGDKECEGKYHEGSGWEKFCLAGEEERKVIWTCDGENKKVLSKNCENLNEPGHAYFCAEAGEGQAECKDIGGCEWYFQEADPFGLYYERQKCYGTSKEEIAKEDTQNYCYYDYTETIVDKCGNCTAVSSCFDYQSQDACEINNCLGTDCQWINATRGLNIYAGFENILLWPTTKETGHGYCVEKDYKKDDRCSRCGPEATLFENYFCTANVCAGLGRCFSYYDLSECKACGEKPGAERNCYSYGTELECTRGQPIENIFGDIILSKDSCGWGRCRWDNPGGAGSCVKDGDGDGVSDCEGLAGQQACRMDNQAPITKIVPEGVNIISYAHPSLTFQGEDRESLMGLLGYCLGSANPSAARCNNFVEVAYPGRLGAEEISLDLINTTLKDEPPITGETYRLRYYSKDEYNNQESAKETFVFIDTQPPVFEIGNRTTTVADTTDLTIYLTGLNEPMSCSFELKPILPLGETITKTAGREETDKEVSFEGLKGIIYNLTVSCEDDYGNVKKESKRYIFDLVKEVNIIYPKGAVGETSIAFEVETLAGASCELYETITGNKIADFVSEDEERKHHQTSPIPGFKQGNYQGAYYAVCEELLTQEVYDPKYFNFIVDLLGPETEIVLQEGTREVRPEEDGWKESFMKSALVSFECPEEGFACNKTYYCLTDNDYEPKISSCFKDYTGPFTLNESTNICYYSDDLGGHEGYPICGSVQIEGMGITLINPKDYYYQEEKWGVSNQAVFNWKIMTKVPTQECKFGWNKDFGYETFVPGHSFDKEGNDYVIEGFPETVPDASPYDEGEAKTVYVKCKDMEGILGPSQKFYLEYDSTAPEIKKVYAEPDPVNEGLETTINIETDDKTLCRFDEGQKEYATMSYPGEEGSTLEKIHNYTYSFGFDGASKLFNLTTQCKNGAGNLSEVKNFTFLVDYSALGNIMGRYVCVGETCYKIEDGVYVASKDVSLKVLTNKNAACKYNGEHFEVTGGKEHRQALTGLSEGEHTYLVHCKIGEEEREGQIKFTVDLTPPVIKEVKDGNISCSLEETPAVFVYTDEEAMSGYYYELYDRGNKTSGEGVLVENGTVGGEIPFKVKADLTENHTYYFKVGGEDAAGNWGGTKESDGFKAVPKSEDKCENDKTAPEVSFVINNTICSHTEVEMHCDDETSCDKFDYEKSFVSGLCEATKSYLGQNILFEKTGWICYYVEDSKGNNKTGLKKINFPDEDGDGIADSCDKCSGTGAGKAVDERGCSSEDVSSEEEEKDTDGDGLPDYWEKMYNAEGCELDWTEEDSTLDGVADTDEDYDKDEYNNFEEYKLGYNPCTADAPPPAVECTTDADCLGEEICKEGVCEAPLITAPPPVEKPKVLAWVLFILGLLMVLGGSGYLIYYYKFRPKSPVRAPARVPLPRVPGAPQPEAAKPKVSLRERLLALMRRREERIKTRKREELFEAFSKKSREIPHVEKVINKAPSLRNLNELVKEHAKVKELVQPGLRYGEKGVFAKLEEIAGKTKEKKIEEVVSKKEAKDIFDKLKEISKKRKEENE